MSPRSPSGDAELVRRFLDGATTGRVGDLEIEGDVLGVLQPPDPAPWALLVRLSPLAFLLRSDVADGARATAQGVAQRVLRETGLVHVPVEPPELTLVAAMGPTGLRSASWDLWGWEANSALSALRASLLGDPAGPPSGDPAVGMTLEELLGEDP